MNSVADAAPELPSTSNLRRIGNQRDVLGECPLWDDVAGVLYWIDIRAPAIRCYDPATERVDSWEMPAMVGAIGLVKDGRLVVAVGTRLVLWEPGSDRFETLVSLPAEIPGHRFNDGRTDREGRFWISTMHNDTRAPEGTLYRLDGRELTPVISQIRVPNSLAWSPNGTVMYFADSLDYGIDAYDFDRATGEPSNRRRFAASQSPAFPDGAAVDAEGNLWSAEFFGSRVVCRRPSGGVARTITMPVDRPTACTFGGPDLRTLFITTTSQNMTESELAAAPLAGALFALGVDTVGLPESRVRLAN